MSVFCEICSRCFTLKKNLNRHQVTCDGTFPSSSSAIKCPECVKSCIFSNMNALKRHISDVHDVQLEEIKLKFNNIDEFKKWKEEYEERNLCLYVKRTTKSKGDEKQSYLRCHRTGFFKSKSKGFRKLKSQGSNKIDSTCPSSMTVCENEAGVNVTFCKTHFGHGSSLDRCSLTNEEQPTLTGTIYFGGTNLFITTANSWHVESLSNRSPSLSHDDVIQTKEICGADDCKLSPAPDHTESLDNALVRVDTGSNQEEEKQSIIQTLNTVIGFLSTSTYSLVEYRNLKRQADQLMLDASKKKTKVVSTAELSKNIDKQEKVVKKKRAKQKNIDFIE